ncbi:unnamed protein product [Cuscuta campestris]|uniref:FBD domain-containing protein n=1 Tax=Cuscuta campestris TaxID=132261 RepID=A0A484MCV5_9ASTE|nr:unnamed protein product [Cuscuta campestris]
MADNQGLTPKKVHVTSSGNLSDGLIEYLEVIMLDKYKSSEFAASIKGTKEYFSHLKYLSVTAHVDSQLNLNMPPLNLTNLKHLRLGVSASFCQTLDGWTALIEASPALQKLTLELYTHFGPGPRYRFRKRHNARPLKCLKILELFGFMGGRVDLGLARYVFENAAVLEQRGITSRRRAHYQEVTNHKQQHVCCNLMFKME